MDDHVVLLPEPWARFDYIRDSLKLLGHNAMFSSAPVVVGELMLPSHTAPTGNFNQDFLDRVRERLLAASPSSASAPTRKVYISRRHAASRAIENEDEILPLLSEYGFEIHHMESYSLPEQLSLMSETKYLLGPHGAGLTNMLFMPTEGSVLEIRARGDAHNNCYFSLASAIGHRYFYALAEPQIPDLSRTSFHIDVAELRSVLSKMVGAPMPA
jgi:capsular polysaccharide biosynthesis protein